MPLADVKRFAMLVHARNANTKTAAAERLAILEAHQKRLRERRVELDACEKYLEFKIKIYRKQVKP
jgi:DNA-binding transcriptional MerR regulator